MEHKSWGEEEMNERMNEWMNEWQSSVEHAARDMFLSYKFTMSLIFSTWYVLYPWTLGIKMKRYIDPLRHMPVFLLILSTEHLLKVISFVMSLSSTHLCVSERRTYPDLYTRRWPTLNGDYSENFYLDRYNWGWPEEYYLDRSNQGGPRGLPELPLWV